MKNRLYLFALSCCASILLSCSWPTSGFPPFIFIAFIPLFLIEYHIRKQALIYSKLNLFIYCYVAFLIWNIYTTGWLFYASPYGMYFAVLANSLLMTLPFLLYHQVVKKVSRSISLFFLIASWICFEKMHLEWDFSWPWLNIGHVFSEYPKCIQWYEYTGTLGGTFWILAINAFLFTIVVDYLEKTPISSKKRIGIVALISFPLLFSLYIYKSYRIEGKTKEVILLQPNVNPYTEKYSQFNTAVVDDLLQTARPFVSDNTAYIITPETVLAEHIQLPHFAYSNAYFNVKNFTRSYPNCSLLLGIDTYDLWTNQSQANTYSNQVQDNLWVNYYNAALCITDSLPTQNHFKSKLVVGVETLPFNSLLGPLLSNFMIDLGGTLSTRTIQNIPSVFKNKSGNFVAPIICYESVYGEYVNQYVQDNAQFLAIMTNDAWWNDTQGHKQHLSLARLRAIETRRDIARSANTGISAFINQRGDITTQTKYNEKTALKGTVHLNDFKTFYVRFGDYIARISFLFFIIILFVSLTKRRHEV